MAVILTSTGIVYNDATSQTTGASTDKGRLLGFSVYKAAGTFTYSATFPTPASGVLTFTTAGTGMSTSGSATGYTITQTGAPNTWTSHAYSAESVTYAGSSPNQTANYIMFGLASNPSSSTSYTNIDYALYYNATNGWTIYESGTNVVGNYPYSSSSYGVVAYDGFTIRYYIGEGNALSCVRTVNFVTNTFYYKAAFYNGGSLSNVRAGSAFFRSASSALVKVVGGGGGASGYTESGGAGGYSEKYVSFGAVDTVTVTVGAGGANVAYYAAGGTGGTSSFGSYASATGGYGCNANLTHTGGQGGLGSSGDVNIYGGGGVGHTNGGAAALGRGGASHWGNSAACRYDSNAVSVTGTNIPPGAGGVGARSSTTWTAGAGSPGMVAVWSFA